MCGIAGAIVFKDSTFEITPEYINKIRDTDSMKLRGPDGFGAWISEDKKVGLAHRRLSIIDLSQDACQPMTSHNSRVVISFNGEIYNHKEIREDLKSKGENKYEWKTDHSDTEVILHAFEEWGIDCVKRFRGMFAIAIWDGNNNRLWLIRDRLGIKPLYYSLHNGRLVFASDLNALLQDEQQMRKVNEEAIYDYLSFLVVPAPKTLFEGIYKMENSTCLKIEVDGTISKQRYWDMFDRVIDLQDLSEKEISDFLIKELQESVKLHKESDVPVGVFLSGGIDSSLNAIMFSENGEEAVKAFTISFDEESGNNEDLLAADLAKKIGADHYVQKLSLQDILNILPKLIQLQGEPLGDPVSGALYYVSKLARENNIVVCQLGEGMDELFYGYPLWFKYKKLNRLLAKNIPGFVKKLMVRLYGLTNGKKGLIYELLCRFSNKQPIFWGTNDVFTNYEKANLLSQQSKSKLGNYTSWEIIKPYFERFNKITKKKNEFNWMTYIDLNLRMSDLLLPKVDKMGMGVSLEARVPFLDHRIVEFALNIPTKYMTSTNNETKHFLKSSLEGIVPNEILHRKKMGFVLPLKDWFDGDLKSKIQREVFFFCDNTTYFDKNEVQKILIGPNIWKIWSIYTLAIWWRIYFYDQPFYKR